MKKVKLNFEGIFFFFLFLPYVCFSQNIVTISSISNGNVINFTLPTYTIKDTSIYEVYNINQTYSYVQITENFGEMTDVGYPNLPQYTVFLHVPSDATVFNVSVSNKISTQKTLIRKILPAQENFEEETNPVFSIENSYYSSNGSLFAFVYQISDTVQIMGAKGIGFSIFPFQYKPSSNLMEIITSCTFTITHNGTPMLKAAALENTITNRYLSQIFYNYPTLKSGAATIGGKYLIITAPNFEETLRYFANYKRNIGYDVTVVTTNITGTSAPNILNYIKTRYNNMATRPNFVLLVGDHGDIPAAGGNPSGNDIDSPITDLTYALLDGDDYFADVFLGRFSVSTTGELINIINKTIFMETNIHRLDKKAKFVAGQGNGNWQENQFE